jgi:tetratricopeptide (TPR) repeat protein
MNPEKNQNESSLWRGLGCVILGLLLLLPAGCGGPARTREIELSLVKRASVLPAASVEDFSPAAAYYYSLSLWFQHHRTRQARAAAVEALDRAVHEAPDSLYLRLELATLLVKSMRPAEAREQARIALEMDPGNRRARRLLADIYALTDQSAAAIEQYEKLLQDEPDDREITFYLVALYVEKLEYEKAQKLLKEYQQHHPNDALGPYYQGKVYAELKLYKDAEEYFLKALRLDPGMVDAWFSLGLIYEFTGRREEAVKAYRKLLDLDSDDRQALERLGQLLIGEGKFKDALKIFERLQAQGEVPVSIDIKIALIYLQQGQYNKAAELLGRLHRLHPRRRRVTFYLASAEEALKHRRRALKLYLEIPEGDELYYDARIHAAFLYEELKEFDRSADIIRGLIAAYPEKAGLYRMLSSLCRKQDDNAGALEALEKAVKLFPDDYKTRFALGVVYSDLGRSRDSIAVMQQLLQENPDDATVLNFIGYTYVEEGVQLDDARKLLEKAIAIKPDSGYILDSLGWLCHAEGNYVKALEYLKKALQAVPDDPVIFEHLGDVELKLGHPDRSRDYYQRSLKIKDNAEVREKLEKLLQKQ